MFSRFYLFSILSLLFVIMGLAGCDPAPPPVEVPPVQLPTIAAPEPTVAVATEVPPEPTAESPVDPTPVQPTATSEVTTPIGDPNFANLTFSERPGVTASADTFIVPNEVFAVWQYANMTAADVVRRDWYFNDALYISREEIWDSTVYGAEGVRTDVSLYDYEDGLEPGSYRVVLSINDEVELEETFSVQAATPLPPDPQNEAAITSISFAMSPNDERRFGSFENVSEVFAIFDYENMSNGDRVKRDWYYNGRLFISREEDWDTGVYGSSGTRSDVSIFDYEDGLAFGDYRLVLSINGEKEMEQRFSVRDAAVGYVPKKINLYGFATTPVDSPGGNEFEAAEEIFAIFNYSDMQPGDVVRREWFFNEEPFINREETWNFDRYGTEGLRKDISIFDFEDGLAFGDYRLLIEVNGEYQSDTTFSIVPLQVIPPITEPQSGRTVESTDKQTILVTYPDGTTQTFTANNRAVHIDWFPGGDKLVYTNQVVIDPNAYPIFGISHELFVINLADGSTQQLTTVDDNMHHPLVSPAGNAIATLQGNGYGDACFVGLTLVVLEVDGSGLLTGRLTPADFSGFEKEFDQGGYTYSINYGDGYEGQTAGLFSMNLVGPGRWTNGITLESQIGYNDCEPPYGGLYSFDFTTKEATLLEAFEFGD